MKINRRERDGRGKREKGGGVTLEEPPSWRDGWRRACRAQVGHCAEMVQVGLGREAMPRPWDFFFFPGNRKTLRDFK